jgi:hypothetical protein
VEHLGSLAEQVGHEKGQLVLLETVARKISQEVVQLLVKRIKLRNESDNKISMLK